MRASWFVWHAEFASQKSLVKICLVVLLGLSLPALALAQDTGYISGTVTDKSGAAVAGADITLTSVSGSITRNTQTNTDGAYVISALPGDTYNLVVTAKGFQKFTAQRVVLQVAEKSRIDVQLTVGTVTEEVVVTGESVAQVQTTSSEVASTITGKQIDNLVLNGRNFTQLVTLSPGVINQQGYDEGKVGVYANVSFAMNGGRVEYNNWELDGGDNMDNGSNSTLNVYPNPEAIAEFKVLTSTYGAQYGRNGSGTVEVETKSGGSTFHGSAFEYLRNDFFNANQFMNNATGIPRPAYKKNDFGYTFSGPIFIPNHYNTNRNKTFFFWSQEWRREKNPSVQAPQNVPSVAERSGTFSDLCSPTAGLIDKKNFPDCPINPATGKRFPGDTVTPTAVGTALEALIPTPNTTSGGFPAFASTVSTPTTWREELIRVDHNITDNYRLTFRYIHDSWSTVVPNPLWGNGTSDFQQIQTNFVGPGTSFVARLNANFTPSLMNEFVASYTADHIFLTALNLPPALPSGSMGAIFPNDFGGVIPSINLTGNTAYIGGANGALAQDTGYFPWNNANPTYTYRDNVTKIMGVHTFQFGAYLAFAQKNEQNSPNLQGILNFSSSASAVTTGNSFADMLLGNVSSYKQWSYKAKYYNRYKIVEPYFQDDWRVNKKLTLNLGLRVSLYGTYRERYQQVFNFNPAAFNPADAPTINPDGSLLPGVGNPLNGIQQCGGKGGTAVLPGFGSANFGGNSNAGCIQGHLFNPAPRIGFAFDPKGDGKLAIRGGYGIFYEHTNGNEGNTESLEGTPPLVLTSTQSNIIGYQNIGGAGANLPFFPLAANGITSIPVKAQWPYMQQWNLNVQKELPSHLFMSVAYVGSKGTHLTLVNNGNQVVPVSAADNPYQPGQLITSADCSSITTNAAGLATGAKLSSGTVLGPNSPGLVNLAVACGATANTPNIYRTNFPGYGNVQYLRTEANSTYQALQVAAHRTVGALTLSAAYTYSHSIDDSSDRSDGTIVNAYDIAANRASSTFDMRHNFSISYVYALPFFTKTGFAHALLGGWQISGITIAQSGTPFSVTNGSTYGDNAGVANGIASAASRPDLIGDPHSGFSSNQEPTVAGKLFYNPAAYGTPTGLTFGDVGRNTLTYPGRLNFDVGVFKRFAINERTGFDFRWENFNFFNHTQFNGINPSFGSTGFLVLNATHNPRIMQFGLRFYF